MLVECRRPISHLLEIIGDKRARSIILMTYLVKVRISLSLQEGAGSCAYSVFTMPVELR